MRTKKREIAFLGMSRISDCFAYGWSNVVSPDVLEAFDTRIFPKSFSGLTYERYLILHGFVSGSFRFETSPEGSIMCSNKYNLAAIEVKERQRVRMEDNAAIIAIRDRMLAHVLRLTPNQCRPAVYPR